VTIAGGGPDGSARSPGSLTSRRDRTQRLSYHGTCFLVDRFVGAYPEQTGSTTVGVLTARLAGIAVFRLMGAGRATG